MMEEDEEKQRGNEVPLIKYLLYNYRDNEMLEGFYYEMNQILEITVLLLILIYFFCNIYNVLKTVRFWIQRGTDKEQFS